MSITFSIQNGPRHEVTCPYCDGSGQVSGDECPYCYGKQKVTEPIHSMNLANVNAADLMRHIKMPHNPMGSMLAKDLRVLCKRALIGVAGEVDPAKPMEEYKVPNGPYVVEVERRAGYLREKTLALLAIAEAAEDGTVEWD